MTTPNAQTAGQHLKREIADSPAAFCRALTLSDASVAALETLDLAAVRGFYTIARGSSDAAANILSYEFMRETGKPMTSLPPSIFSTGQGVDLTGNATLVVSQSGASGDLVRSAKGAASRGSVVVGLVNQPGSDVQEAAHVTLPLNAGPELAVPATKSVIASIAAGMALLGYLVPDYATRATASAKGVLALEGVVHPRLGDILASLSLAEHVYIIGRDTGFGAAQELALKLKETCALHAEAYASSEVLHGPLQLATRPLFVLILDTDEPEVQASLDAAEARFGKIGTRVYRIRPSDVGAVNLTPAAAAAALLCLTYPLVLDLALSLGLNPDHPETLSKVTQTL